MIIATQIHSTLKYITKVLKSTIKPTKKKKKQHKQNSIFSMHNDQLQQNPKKYISYIHKPNKISNIAWKKQKIVHCCYIHVLEKKKNLGKYQNKYIKMYQVHYSKKIKKKNVKITHNEFCGVIYG
jgi:hypothetical protein